MQLKYLWILSFLFLGFNNTIYSQIKITGNTQDIRGEYVPNCMIIAKNYITDKLIAYTLSDEFGNYNIDIPDHGKVKLSFRCIGYFTKDLLTEIKESSEVLTIDVVLELNPNLLDEVIVHENALF